MTEFVDDQKQIWTEQKLSRVAGGDGSFAQERLGFGFMIENAHYQIYRVWSRAWLLTK